MYNRYNRLDKVAEAEIPIYTTGRFFPKPWWSAELTESYKERERTYHKGRARKSPQNKTQWKKMQAKHRKAVIEHKKNSWEEAAIGMTSDVRKKLFE